MRSDNGVLIKMDVLEITKRWSELKRKSSENVETPYSMVYMPIIFNVHNSKYGRSPILLLQVKPGNKTLKLTVTPQRAVSFASIQRGKHQHQLRLDSEVIPRKTRLMSTWTSVKICRE